MPMKTITVTDRETQTIQQNAAAAISNLESATQINMTQGGKSQTSITTPFSGGGHLLTGVTLTSGQDNLIAHHLATTPSVWVICDVNVATNIFSPPSVQLANQSSNAQYLNLQASITAVVSVWVA